MDSKEKKLQEKQEKNKIPKLDMAIQSSLDQIDLQPKPNILAYSLKRKSRKE